MCTGCVNGQERLRILNQNTRPDTSTTHRYPLPEFSTTGTVVKETSVEVQVPPPIPHPTVTTGVTVSEDDTPVIVGGYTIGGSHVTLHQTKDKRVVDVMVEFQLLQGDKGAGKRGRKGTPRQPCAECLKLGGRMTQDGSLLDVKSMVVKCPGKGGSRYCLWFNNPNFKL